MHGTVLNVMTIQRLIFPSILKSYCLSRWCLQARGCLNTIAWNFSDLPDSTKLISPASQTHSLSFILFAHFGSFASAHQHAQKDENKPRNPSHLAPCQPPWAFLLFYFPITLFFNYSLASILNPTLDHCDRFHCCPLIDNSNAPFLILKL